MNKEIIGLLTGTLSFIMAESAIAECRFSYGDIRAIAEATPGDIEILVNRAGHTHRYLQNIIPADRPRDGFDCTSDLIIGDNYVAVRSGQNRDRISFFGVENTGRIAASGMHLNREFQGISQFASLEALPTSFIAKFDHQQKRSVRFCFHNNSWYGSDESADNAAPADCTTQLQIVGYSSQVQ